MRLRFSLLLFLAAPLQAQVRLTGTVYDSLVTNKPLSGATVMVVGTMLSGITDSRGRFQIDSVPAGRAHLTFFHQVIDSINVGAGIWEVDASGGRAATLATPSGVTLRRKICPDLADTTTGLLLGRVQDVDNRSPVADARIQTQWMELTFTRGVAAHTVNSHTLSLADGAFALCGVPIDVPYFVRASINDRATGPVEVFGRNQPVAFQQLSISFTDTTARLSVDSILDAAFTAYLERPPGSASLDGLVRDRSGRPIKGARVMLTNGGRTTETGNDGRFRLVGLPAGSQTFDVRAIGYTPTRRVADLRSSTTNEVVLELDKSAPSLPTVTVLGSSRLERAGFLDRQRRGLGYYVDEAWIERQAGGVAMDVIERAPGLIPEYIRTTGGRTIRAVVMRRSGPGVCFPKLFVDGFSYAGGWEDLRTFVHKTEIVGIEVYTSSVSVPVEFDGHNGCGSVVVWTRR